ncbi:aldo/keto reductase [Bacteroides sp.]|uniref:aldo/keto reductase n=1 Tax=Bacteroides TaxID=816 RepID=UPI003529CB82
MEQPIITFPNGQTVCPLGQGTWKMGQSVVRRNEEIRALRHGIDLGMSIVDTAEMYDNEELVGEAIHDCRDKVFLVSKVLPSNASYGGTKIACEHSLRRLGTEYIDLYLLHWKGRHPYEETVRAMTELQQEGKIRMWGVSNLDVADMEYVVSRSGGSGCVTDQVLYNLGDRGVEFDLLPWCTDRRMPVMAYSPIGEGRLLHHRILVEIARRHDASPAQIALAWMMSQPGIIAIPKAGSVAHVEENFRSLSVIRLTDEDLHDLDTAFPAPTRKMPLVGW